jgi:hypothetical protein
MASVAVHLVGRGYAVRLVDGSSAQDTANNPWAQELSGLGGEASSSVVLDSLATVSAAGAVELQRAVHSAARAATGGLVVAALGELTDEDVALLAGLHQPGTSCVALLADTTSVIQDAGLREQVQREQRVQVEQLRASGWDVVPVREQEPLDATWRRVGSGRLVVGRQR